MVTCGGLCDEGQCVESCSPNTSKCLTVSILQICTAQGLTTTMVCDQGCANGACLDITACEPGEVVCDKAGSQLVKCNSFGSAYFTFELCESTCSEETDACVDVICNPGDVRCSPSQFKVVETCDSAGTVWKPTAFCDGKCEQGACKEVNCDAGVRQCGPQGIEECNAEESGFDLVEPCETGCGLNANGQPTCGLCVQGATQCKGNIVEKCFNSLNGWKDYLLCGSLQTCELGECYNKVTLNPTSPMKSNLMTLTLAFVNCWQSQAVGFCRSINTTGLTYPISADDLSSWFCDEAEKSDFIDQSAYDTAHDIMGCGLTNLEDMTFVTTVISPNLNGAECIGLADAEIIIDYCVNF